MSYAFSLGAVTESTSEKTVTELLSFCAAEIKHHKRKIFKKLNSFGGNTVRKFRTLDEIIQDELKDETSRNKYLEIAVEDYFENGEEAELLLAIRQVVIAGIGFSALSERTGLSRESLYKSLSGNGNPKLKTLQLILSALGYGVKVKRKIA